MARQLRIGLMASSTEFTAWEADAIGCLREIPGLEISLLILEGKRRIAAPKAPVGFLSRSWTALRDGSMISKLIYRFNWLAWKSLYPRYRAWQFRRGRVPAQLPVQLESILAEVPRIQCDTMAKGRFAETFLAADVEAIRAAQLDVILKFGFNIIHGDILQAARFGVWSFHHDDHLRYRGGPPAFWEVVSGDPWTGAMLQRINEKLDDGLVLHKEFFRTSLDSYSHNLHRVWRGSASWPALCCLALQNEGQLAGSALQKSDAPIYRVPTNGQMLGFFNKVLRAKVQSRLNPQGRLQEQWGIGHFPGRAESFLSQGVPDSVSWLVTEPGSFCADPFVFGQGGQDYLFFERFDFATGLGSIAVTSTRDWKDFSPVRVVLSGPGQHYSYPFVFEANGQVYAIPEQSKLGCVELYELADFPTGWKKVSVLLPQFAGIDPTVFFRDGLWWMLVGGPDTEVDRLYAFYAEQLSGPWKPHDLNPIVITSARRSRPAGRVFQTSQGLFRPAQYGHRYYGYGLLLYRIDVLNPREYSETLVRIETPQKDWPFADGIHHLDFTSNRAIIDGKFHFHGPPPTLPAGSYTPLRLQ